MTSPTDDRAVVEVRVLSTTSLTSDRLANWMATLSPDECTRAERFRFDDDRRDYIAAHALTRRALSGGSSIEPKDWTLVRDAYGKPRVSAMQAGAPPLEFSLSHTRGLVACAVTRMSQVGIDVECTDRGADAETIANRYFSAAEAEWIRLSPASDRPSRFVELWTLKEAFIKAEGKGLALPLNECEFSFDNASGLSTSGPRSSWCFFLGAAGSSGRLAVAFRSNQGTPPPIWIHVEGPGAETVTPLRWTAEVRWRITGSGSHGAGRIVNSE